MDPGQSIVGPKGDPGRDGRDGKDGSISPVKSDIDMRGNKLTNLSKPTGLRNAATKQTLFSRYRGER